MNLVAQTLKIESDCNRFTSHSAFNQTETGNVITHKLNIPSIRIKQAERHVDCLKRWMFKASLKNRRKIVEYVAKLLKRSYDNFLLALHRITKSSGNKTTGVDKKRLRINDLGSYRQALKFFNRYFRGSKGARYKPKPLRRVYIPKPDGSQRPLGIPTHFDRLAQAILTPAIEVINERNVYNHKLNTFGFRPYLKTADAINNLSIYAWKGKHAAILEMDIEKCFDKIDHQAIIKLMDKYGLASYNPYVEKMLKAGFIDIDGTLKETPEGTPQGGVISPALCNLVVREYLDIPMTTMKIKGYRGINCISYADDAVITLTPNDNHKPNEAEIQCLKEVINKNLKEAGLRLKEAKTRIILDDTPFDFLGYEIRRGKGIRPSKKKLIAHHRKVKNLLRRKSRMNNVNSVIRGFYNYYANFSSKVIWKSLGKLDWYNGKWLWKNGMDTNKIVKYTDIPKTTRYISPLKGSSYLTLPEWFKARIWGKRDKFLHKKQKGNCPVCEKPLGNTPFLLETHHVQEKTQGGKDNNRNVILIHKSCHQHIHSK